MTVDIPTACWAAERLCFILSVSQHAPPLLTCVQYRAVTTVLVDTDLRTIPCSNHCTTTDRLDLSPCLAAAETSRLSLLLLRQRMLANAVVDTTYYCM